ncbi:hypothetical protein Dimus_003830 [Dionaea muscipula]
MAISSKSLASVAVPGNNPIHGDNVLAKHVEFFDKNKDGIVYPWETFKGFRAIGCGIALSSTAAVIINAGLSSKTRPVRKFSLHHSVLSINFYALQPKKVTRC